MKMFKIRTTLVYTKGKDWHNIVILQHRKKDDKRTYKKTNSPGTLLDLTRTN